MRRWWGGRSRTSPAAPADPEPTLQDLIGLSMQVPIPRRTGMATVDDWNQAIACVQSFLNGRAVAAETMAEKAYLLRLRADLTDLHVAPAEAPAAASGHAADRRTP